MPTAILAYLGFRNIQNEVYLAQKNFDENSVSFQSEIEDAVSREQKKIHQEAKGASLFLYEQPHGLLDFGNATEFKSVDGIEAMFLFNKGNLVYPDISSRHFSNTQNFSTSIPSNREKSIFAEEQENPSSQDKIYQNRLARSMHPSALFFDTPEEQVQNLLGMIRYNYQKKNYDNALELLEILEKRPHQQGYLHADLARSANLLHFEILVAQKKHQEAQEYCLRVFKEFFEDQNITDIASSRFFFESAFTQILSFEKLPQERRDAFWNLRENFNRQLGYMEILFKHKEMFSEILEDNVSSKEGILYKQNDDVTLLRMSYPYLSGDQVVIAKINNKAYKDRLISKMKLVAQSWKSIPFSVVDQKDSIVLGSIPDSSSIVSQATLSDAMNWEFTLYEKDMRDIKQESRKRMFLMYGLMLFSLIAVFFGSFFMFRFVIQERKLLSMKANFLSSVSHELKTPLTSIKMLSETMSRGRVQKMEKIQEYSNLIGKEATRLENLIGAILNYTRMEHGTGAFKWEKLDFSVCTQKVFDAVEDIGIEKGLEFQVHFEPGAYVMGDYTALYSLAQNLIENAIKYTNAPGKITVDVQVVDNHVIFSVMDTGVGIPSSEQKNIFNDFYRFGDEMTRSTKGSGLGLAIVKRVVKTHRATISLISKPGKGSTFTVKFKKAE